ncbi:MAG TPA: hypothetical protein PKY59_13750 [Pyrinomonadaceae bacterium]|nr:hypothetical protein [Pyrinomonadaceae bacterium]
MKKAVLLFIIAIFSLNISAQTEAQKIYETEKAFERASAEKSINQAFIEFTAPDGVCFLTGAPSNCREFWKQTPASAAFLTWNPTFIDISSNGLFAVSTGNSIYRAKGKDDANASYGEYLTVWQRQPDNSYKAVVDIGVSHEKPEKIETEWKTAMNPAQTEQSGYAGDTAAAFFETLTKQGIQKAYKNYAAEDIHVLREGKMPFASKSAWLAELKKDKSQVTIKKRTSFFGAADFAYTTNGYSRVKPDKTTENGNFVQVWKLKNGKWQIAFDVFLPSNQ